jgi:hypothetical protein
MAADSLLSKGWLVPELQRLRADRAPGVLAFLPTS